MSQTPAEQFNIAVPTGDPYFDPAATGTKVIGLTRSQYDSATGLGIGNVRQQVNSITAFIDGSQIYGSDAATAASLRTFSGGKLKGAKETCSPSTPRASFRRAISESTRTSS
jgi:peroxidase